jgi:predicted O-methyltransferase YrrM
MSDIESFLAERGVVPGEGSASPAELAFLMDLASRPEMRHICEIGFNAGISADGFLRANVLAHVTSFDIGTWPYVEVAKEFIDREFPGRHKLVLGDSMTTVPEFARREKGLQFDLIFIDGSHKYEWVRADLFNARLISSEQTLVVVDDLMPWLPWGIEPACAWYEAVVTGLIRQETLAKDGTIVERIDPPAERAWGVGRYSDWSF